MTVPEAMSALPKMGMRTSDFFTMKRTATSSITAISTTGSNALSWLAMIT